MAKMEANLRFVAILVSLSFLSVATVLGATLLSVGIVVAVKSSFTFLLRVLAALTEIIVALVAAITSGGTVTLSVLVAAGSAGMAIPASLLELRVAVSAAVSAAAIVMAACTVFYLTTPSIDMELAVAVTSAAGLAVACASAWAVGVMSLIERETQQVGLKMTSILDAVRNNKRFMLRLLVKLHAGFQSRDHDLDLALLHAVKAGFVECTEILLGAGANRNVADGHGNTPLIHACEIGNNDVVKLLIDVGCDVNKYSNNGCTALHHASKWGFVKCIEDLLEKGAEVNIQDLQGRTALMLAATHAQDANNVMRILIKEGSDVNLMGFEGRRVIHYAASRGLELGDVIAAGADLDSRDEEGNQALHYAAFKGGVSVVKTLIESGADPNSCNFSGGNAIQFAAIRGNLQCVDALVQANGDPSVIDLTGKTALCHATENNNLSVVIYLIQFNTPFHMPSGQSLDPNIMPVDPVSMALEKRFIHIVRVLVIGGFSCKVLFDWLNHTPEELWVEGKIEHVSWLRDFLSNPPLLSHITRLVIRQRLGTDVPRKLPQLPLPTKLKEYVSFAELSERAIIGGQSDDIGDFQEIAKPGE